MFNNVALDWTFMVALSNLNKSFNGSKGKPTGNLVFLPQKDRLPADFRKKTGIVRWSCNRTHAGWAFRLMVSSYGCSPTLMAWTQPNYAPYTKPHAEIDFFTEIAATQFIPILLTKKNWAQRNLQPSQRPQNRIPLGSPVIKHGW
jgi:hypothetical protein